MTLSGAAFCAVVTLFTLKTEIMLYCTIIHELRKEWDITPITFMILDTVDQLARNVKFGGWCTSSRKYIAETLGIGERTVKSSLKELEERGLIEINALRHLRPTDHYNDRRYPSEQGGAKIARPVQNLHGEGVQKLHSTCAKSAPYNNKIINTNDNIGERQKKFQDELREFADQYSPGMLKNFYDYWSELGAGGKRMRFELEKTWELKKRLRRWASNNFGGNGFNAHGNNGPKPLSPELMELSNQSKHTQHGPQETTNPNVQ